MLTLKKFLGNTAVDSDRFIVARRCCSLLLVDVVQNEQINELLFALDTLKSIMSMDPILNSFDVIETDSSGHINYDVIGRYVIIY